MVIWTFVVCLSLVLTAGNPVREPNGYDYNVKHPGGSSNVRVRTGGSGNTSPYLHKANADYISDATYLDPRYVGPPPDTLRKYDGHHGNNYNYEPHHGRTEYRGPVYVEHSKPDYQPITSQGHYDSPYPILPQRHAAPQPRYANPPFSQQTYFNDDTPKYHSNKFEQSSLDVQPNYEPIQKKYPDDKVILVAPEPKIVQQVVTDDIQEPIDYPDRKISQLPLIKAPAPVEYVKSPIEQQQVLVDEPEEIPVIYQKPLEQTPVLSQKTVEVPSTKSIPVVKSPIIQQSSLDAIHQSSLVDYMNNDEISQKPIKESPIVQQVSDDGDHYPTKLDSYGDKPILKQVVQENINPSDVVIGKSYGSPLIQSQVEDHPSQAVYDSSIEPSFSDTDHQIPSYSYASRPKYQFVPSGPPYERISHSTEIIHGPASSPYSIKVPQKNVKSYVPVNKSPPVYQSIKAPPPITKTAVPLELSQQQEHVDTDLFLTKNPPPPPPPSVKLPPPPPPSVKLPPPPPPSVKLPPPPPPSVKLPPPPPSVKLPPPPPPITKSIAPVIVTQVQEPVDIILTKNPPPPPSIKLPPPPSPVTKTFTPVVAQVQEPIDVQVQEPVDVQVQEPVDVQVQEPVDVQVQEPVDIILTKDPPRQLSVKLPPPPVTKSVRPSIVTQVQEPEEIIFTKRPPTSYSVKAPPPVYKPFIPYRPPIKAPFYGHTSVPQPRVKLPPPRPYWDKPHYANTQYVKRPPPIFSVKQPYKSAPIQSNYNIRYGSPYSKQQSYEVPHVKTQTYGNPHIKYPPYEAPRIKSYPYGNPPIKSYPNVKSPPISHGIKVPAAKTVHSVKVPKASVKTNGPPLLKTPPLTPPWIRSAVQEPISKNPSYNTGPVAQPYNSNIDSPHSGYSADVSWDEDNVPGSHPEEIPYHSTNEGFHSEIPLDGPLLEKPEEKSPFEKYAPVSHAIRLPSVIPSSEPKSDLSATLNDKVPSIDNLEKSPFDKYPPVSHAVRLPSVIPTTPPMPNLFAAVPSTDSVADAHSESLQSKPPQASHAVILPLEVSQPSVSALRTDTLSNPVPNAVRRPLRGRSYNVDEDYDEPKQDFPAFPVESALKQKDPVSDKVSHLTRSFRPDYLHSEHEPDENESKSINDARAEVARVNKEIGVSFGDRLPRRSRYS